MPEMPFQVRWPDGSCEACYSPSTIIAAHLAAGVDYTIAEFLTACRRGLRAASDRVRDVYGHGCSNAMDQLAAIERRAEHYGGGDIVRVESVGGTRCRSA